MFQTMLVDVLTPSLREIAAVLASGVAQTLLSFIFCSIPPLHKYMREFFVNKVSLWSEMFAILTVFSQIFRHKDDIRMKYVTFGCQFVNAWFLILAMKLFSPKVSQFPSAYLAGTRVTATALLC